MKAFTVQSSTIEACPEKRMDARHYVDGKCKCPKPRAFMAFGDLVVPGFDEVSFVVFRIPGRGTNWHKKVLPAVRRIVKPMLSGPKANWTVGGGNEEDGKDLWATKLTRRYDWDWKAQDFKEVAR